MRAQATTTLKTTIWKLKHDLEYHIAILSIQNISPRLYSNHPIPSLPVKRKTHKNKRKTINKLLSGSNGNWKIFRWRRDTDKKICQTVVETAWTTWQMSSEVQWPLFWWLLYYLLVVTRCLAPTDCSVILFSLLW